MATTRARVLVSLKSGTLPRVTVRYWLACAALLVAGFVVALVLAPSKLPPRNETIYDRLDERVDELGESLETNADLRAESRPADVTMTFTDEG